MSAFPSLAHKQKLLALLRVHHIKEITVPYSGSGDSGNIEEAFAVDHAGNEVDLTILKIDWPQSQAKYNNITHKWERADGESLQTLAEVLGCVCNDALQDSGLDWYNNDGGQGELKMTFPDDGAEDVEIVLNVGVNVTTTEDHTFDLSDGIDLNEQPNEEN